MICKEYTGLLCQVTACIYNAFVLMSKTSILTRPSIKPRLIMRIFDAPCNSDHVRIQTLQIV